MRPLRRHTAECSPATRQAQHPAIARATLPRHARRLVVATDGRPCRAHVESVKRDGNAGGGIHARTLLADAVFGVFVVSKDTEVADYAPRRAQCVAAVQFHVPGRRLPEVM